MKGEDLNLRVNVKNIEQVKALGRALRGCEEACSVLWQAHRIYADAYVEMIKACDEFEEANDKKEPEL